jgi:hypothetical protein
MFGLFHPGEGVPAGGRAALLCNPFGQEAVRGHRVYRVLAERLARKGIPTLRFDYHATGDSPGDDEDGDLLGWTADVRTALRELVARSGATSTICVGSRLGAALAIRASAGAESLRRLVLWDPVVDGAAYLAQLRVKHVEALESSFSVADPAWNARLAGDPTAFTDEAIGFGISPALRSQIAQLGPHSLALPPGVDTHVVAAPGDMAAQQWFTSLQARGVGARMWPLDEAFDWTASERKNSPLVPPKALATLLSSASD